MVSQHCAYWWPGSLAPGYPYPQYWLLMMCPWISSCLWVLHSEAWPRSHDSVCLAPNHNLYQWWLTHWGQDKMATMFQTTFPYVFHWIKMFEFRLRFHWSLFLRFVLTYSSIGSDTWLGTDQATSHYLNQWWLFHWRIYTSLGLDEFWWHKVSMIHNELNIYLHCISHSIYEVLIMQSRVINANINIDCLVQMGCNSRALTLTFVIH